MQISIVGSPKSSQSGFTYVMILVVVMITGIFAEVATFNSSRLRQMDREAELLFRGASYRNAIKSYYESGKPIKSYPQTLNDLVKDPRVAHSSHLRFLYPDPFDKENVGWKLLRATDGGISGISSQSMETPLKKGNFKLGFEKFEGATSYADWVFEYLPASAVPARKQ